MKVKKLFLNLRSAASIYYYVFDESEEIIKTGTCEIGYGTGSGTVYNLLVTYEPEEIICNDFYLLLFLNSYYGKEAKFDRNDILENDNGCGINILRRLEYICSIYDPANSKDYKRATIYYKYFMKNVTIFRDMFLNDFRTRTVTCYKLPDISNNFLNMIYVASMLNLITDEEIDLYLDVYRDLVCKLIKNDGGGEHIKFPSLSKSYSRLHFLVESYDVKHLSQNLVTKLVKINIDFCLASTTKVSNKLLSKVCENALELCNDIAGNEVKSLLDCTAIDKFDKFLNLLATYASKYTYVKYMFKFAYTFAPDKFPWDKFDSRKVLLHIPKIPVEVDNTLFEDKYERYISLLNGTTDNYIYSGFTFLNFISKEELEKIVKPVAHNIVHTIVKCSNESGYRTKVENAICVKFELGKITYKTDDNSFINEDNIKYIFQECLNYLNEADLKPSQILKVINFLDILLPEGFLDTSIINTRVKKIIMQAKLK